MKSATLNNIAQKIWLRNSWLTFFIKVKAWFGNSLMESFFQRQHYCLLYHWLLLRPFHRVNLLQISGAIP